MATYSRGIERLLIMHYACSSNGCENVKSVFELYDYLLTPDGEVLYLFMDSFPQSS